MPTTTNQKEYVLIGAGIMSATLGIMMKKLMPDAKISIYERLDKVGAESSAAWNNAGTGHSSFCELNYTPELEDGSIDISKAIRIAESFEISKQFWSYLKRKGHLPKSESFINDIPHMSFVWGEENVRFLKKRYDALVQYPIFKDMIYTEDLRQIEEWVPLMMRNRVFEENMAVTRMEIGTDVNFGAITRGMMKHLGRCKHVNVHMGHNIDDLTQQADGRWEIDVTDLKTGKERKVMADFVFIGAGGGAIPLLEKSDIPEGSAGSPPMSVPHLDTRFIDGERALLFGPYAGFSTKFLKNGSYLDLPFSIEMHNIWPMLAAGAKNLGLTKYLIEQVVQSPEDRFAFLQKFYPDAKFEDWNLEIAGQRVQIIKKDESEGGVLKFGTEVVTSADKSLSALLGASPGASTSVSIMIDVLLSAFPEKMASPFWQRKMRAMIPSYGKSLIEDGDLCLAIREETSEVLKLDD